MRRTSCENCLLRNLSALKELEKDQLQQLSLRKESIMLKKGEPIFKEGVQLKGIYCVADGICKLSKLGESGKDQIIKLVGKGTLLGQRSIINEETANLSATAMTDGRVCFLPRQEISQFIYDNTDFIIGLTQSICNDLKDADNYMTDMAQKTVKERIKSTLLRIKNLAGMDEHNALMLQISREDLANIVGTATESCIRLLAELRREGFIELEGKKIILKEPLLALQQ